MRRMMLAAAGGLALAAGAAAAADGAADPFRGHEFQAAAHTGAHWELLNQYCVDCHNFEDWAGGVAFDLLQPDAIPQDAEIWEETVRKLRGHLMPPPGEPRPDNARIDDFVAWMESYLDEAAEVRSEPGHIVLHRLNRTEYRNAVRDLFGLELDAEALLPRDDASDGFNNVANVLQVTPSFLEQYLQAARSVAVTAVGERAPRPAATQYFNRNAGLQTTHVEGLPLGTRGGMLVEHLFPADGEYQINIADMARALWVVNMEFENTLIVTVDGRKVYQTTLGGEEDMKAIDQRQDPAVDAINARLKDIRFSTTAGPHQVAVTFLHRTFAESDDRLQIQTPGGGQDRILGVTSFEIRGPFNPTGLSETPSRKRIFTCHPDRGDQEDACAQRILRDIATRAFRRPVGDADLASLLAAYEQGRRGGDFEAGIRRGLTAVLASPYFLYRVEPTPEDAAPGSVYALTDLELASRLAFFLWSSLPDEELLAVAQAGRLHREEVLEAQVRRMLADPRSEALASNFAFQWLNIAKLDEVVPDSKIFPDASGAGDPREDFKTELRLFVDSVFREDRSVLDLLSADHTYLNERLATHYDIRDVKGSQWRRVKLRDSYRHGLLGKGAILTLSAYPNRTSPVLRGAWIMDYIVGTPPAAPPPGVEALSENVEGGRALTVRERLEAHSQQPSCHACHGVIDPLGFALENFDAVGRWREIDRWAGTPIESGGVLPDGTEVKDPDALRAALLARPEQFVQTLTQKLMTYALGRKIEYLDMPVVRRIVRSAAGHDYRFSAIVLAIVNSDPFRLEHVPRGEPIMAAPATAAHP